MTNIWKQFESLLPDTPKFFATIAAVETGRVRVETPSGGTLFALGTGTVGEKVWVQDGKVVGEAADLVHYDIELY